MNARNCRKCGRLFNYAMGPIMCQQCRDALEGKFKEVKDYIQQHPACGIQEVSRECDVETSQIQQWLREERLEFTADSMVQLNCEGCGAPIRSGRYCESCSKKLRLQSEAEKAASHKSNFSGYGKTMRGESGARRFMR